jgi:hypothetical protein
MQWRGKKSRQLSRTTNPAAANPKRLAPAASKKCCSACSKLPHPCHPERSDCFALREAVAQSKDPIPACSGTSSERSFPHRSQLRGVNSLRHHRQRQLARDPSTTPSLASRPPTPLRMTEQLTDERLSEDACCKGRETGLGLWAYERFAKRDKQPLGGAEGGPARYGLGKLGSGLRIAHRCASGAPHGMCTTPASRLRHKGRSLLSVAPAISNQFGKGASK